MVNLSFFLKYETYTGKNFGSLAIQAHLLLNFKEVITFGINLFK